MESLQVDIPSELKRHCATEMKNTEHDHQVEVLQQLTTKYPHHFYFEGPGTFITPQRATELAQAGNIEIRDVWGLKLKDVMHDGIFAGGRSFNEIQTTTCHLCGFTAMGKALFFTLLDAWGRNPDAIIKPTPELLVQNFINDLSFLENYSKEQITALKKGNEAEHGKAEQQRVFAHRAKI